jgi:mannose/fructose/N-acetylgalactosamine-specific phosphotransferase system component IIC
VQFHSTGDLSVSLVDQATEPAAEDERKGINSLFMLVIWTLWKEKNARLFNGSSMVAQEVVQKVRHELQLWVMAGANQLGRLVHE